MRQTLETTRGVNLIVALRFCKAHYRTYPYFTHFISVDVFSLDRNTVSSLKIQALNAEKRKALLGTPCSH